MATTGSVDINLTPIGRAVNNGTQLGERIIGGVNDQGDLIGLAIGIAIAVGLLLTLIFLVLAFVPKLIKNVKGIRQA